VRGRTTGVTALRVARLAGCALRDALRVVVDFAVPDVCGLCGAPTGAPPRLQGLPAPVRCLATPATVTVFGCLSVINHPFCRRCLIRFEARRGGRRSITGTSGAPSDLEVIAPFSMNDASLGLVHLIKFAGRTSLAPMAAAAMAKALGRRGPTGALPVLVPVPMHLAARRRRGFNQAEVLGRGLSRLTGIPLAEGAIVKRRRTRPQSVTEHDRRAANVRGAFQPGGFPLAGRSVYLVDDLVTTGSTASACAAAALAAGAVDVCVVCLAASP
jgi:ComF family protein